MSRFVQYSPVPPVVTTFFEFFFNTCISSLFSLCPVELRTAAVFLVIGYSFTPNILYFFTASAVSGTVRAIRVGHQTGKNPRDTYPRGGLAKNLQKRRSTWNKWD